MITFENEMMIQSFDKFHKFIQPKCYEYFLLDLMNNSKIFENDLVHIDSQANGEYDYISTLTGKTYEATLLMTDQIASAFIKNHNYWFSDEFSNWIFNEAKRNIVERLEKKKKKNSIVLFNIFPMRHSRVSSGFFSQFASDNWDLISESVIKDRSDLINNKDIYLGYTEKLRKPISHDKKPCLATDRKEA